MPQRKKAGCNSYANVTDDYTLYEKIMPQNSIATPTKAVFVAVFAGVIKIIQ